ncbi:hypothetical protein GA0116948_105263 [Chitinophaga costaii]|uniref:Fasciclin domain-containing protein n=1 Tax=Chitinophaga costaii TaxID=1335309 RepID=A0A1C4DGY8_9BACT|nr:hypothetical protein [Chitinophaga costaii]PUZ24624.1 hypothetical protein DCM91_12080 [Chitinophaga costaii]SCC30480.1 hypothetical protein GA0116948_105263 [Chitinophaga costaii]
MKHKLFLPLLALVAVSVFSCKRDYTIGGTVLDPHVNLTTYDYLKTNKLFDTLVLLIDRTGLKDEVNAAGTFFAVSNYSIDHYIDAKKSDLETKLNDENLVYTFDSLDYASLKDSLRAYMFKDRILNADQNTSGRLFTANDGEVRMVNLVPDNSYTNDIFTQAPLILYLNKMIADSPGETIPTDSTGIGGLQDDQLLKTRCQTSGIITTTGVLHVLNNAHTWTYFQNQYN